MMNSMGVSLNGRACNLHTDDDRTLLWVLRTDLALTGTNAGHPDA
jgi:aerobic-type carbon monoxide dehydrogenase small subunit (CoxS/CutS family)